MADAILRDCGLADADQRREVLGLRLGLKSVLEKVMNAFVCIALANL